MNSKLQKLNEKILSITKLAEQNKICTIQNKSKEEEEKNLKDNFYMKTNIDKNLILKGRINLLENDYNLKISKLNSKYDELTNELNKISDYLNLEYDSENSYNLNLIQAINNIKNDLENIYNQENIKLEQQINYYSQNLNNKILSIENYDINELLKEKKNILDLEKFSQEIISEIINKINLNNMSSDTDKKEKSQEICKGLAKDDEELINDLNDNEKLLNELKEKFNNSINDLINNFINIEESKRNNFKSNIFEILSETLNDILANQEKK